MIDPLISICVYLQNDPLTKESRKVHVLPNLVDCQVVSVRLSVLHDKPIVDLS